MNQVPLFALMGAPDEPSSGFPMLESPEIKIRLANAWEPAKHWVMIRAKKTFNIRDIFITLSAI